MLPYVAMSRPNSAGAAHPGPGLTRAVSTARRISGRLALAGPQPDPSTTRHLPVARSLSVVRPKGLDGEPFHVLRQPSVKPNLTQTG